MVFRALIVLFFVAQAWAADVVTVQRVIDGDTFETVDGVVVRLSGIDAPEKRQAFGSVATRWLQILVEDRQVELRNRKRAAWGRVQAEVVWKDVDVNGSLVRWGAAWVDSRYPASRSGEWLKWQAVARADALGLWKGPKAIPPWDWRAR